jgi:hypothetical protein
VLKVQFLLTLLFLVSCGSGKQPEKEIPSLAIRAKYSVAVKRLADKFLEGGWVVARDINGNPEHVGEGLLWTGLWLAAAPCDDSALSDQMLREVIAALDGALVRYLPLGEYEGGREVTLDGALGLYRGVAERIERCGGGTLWAPVIAAHLKYIEEHDQKFNANSKATLDREFTYVLDLLGYRLGVRGKPSTDRLRLLGGQVSAWAAAVVANKAAAYRVHLGFLTLDSAEVMGEKVDWFSFCAASNGVDIPLIDNKCGRGDLKGWIEQFRFNEWEYRHQRSGKWEQPDGHGDETPGLDLITAIRAAYDI